MINMMFNCLIYREKLHEGYHNGCLPQGSGIISFCCLEYHEIFTVRGDKL